MNALLAIVRFAHLLAAISLFGGFVFVLAVGGPAKRADAHGNALEWNRLSRRLRAIGGWSLGIAVVSAAAWFALEAALVGGSPFIDAMSGDVLGRVATETMFGRAWLWRFAIAIALAVVMLYEARSSMVPRRALANVATALAAIYLATLAWAGHAAAGQGADRLVRIGTDGAHLLAAGAWVGALPGLVMLLWGARRVAAVASIDVAARAARCFSWLGIASVGVLVVSGAVNAWYLVGDIPHLIGTSYGQLLLVKLALFVAMLALAAVNRARLTPRVSGRDFVALHKLSRNAAVETIIGIAVVAIVGVLGITVPGAHQEPTWPLSFTLQVESVDPAFAAGWIVAVIVTVACAAVAWIIALRRPSRPSAMRITSAALVVLGVAAITCPYVSIAPAYPTTYATSPVGYTTSAIFRGGVVYADNCAQCHGARGHGDGPLAVSLSPKPVDLVVHSMHHSAGDMFWWIAHGIAGTAMPPFGARIADAQIWSVIQFLRAQSAANDASQLTASVETWRPLVAPDFTFEIGTHGQESLKSQRGRYAVLLVLYSMPQSLDRLRALAADDRLTQAGLRVIAIPANVAAQISERSASALNSIVALVDPDVPATYAMFAARDGADGRSIAQSHVEFLVDRGGYLRARWLAVPTDSSKQTKAIIDQVAALNEEPPREAAPEAHIH